MNLEDKPALKHLLTAQGFIKPAECWGCPFGKPKDLFEHLAITGDPAKQEYLCGLLSKTVWGTEPKCEMSDWQARARSELESQMP